MCLLTRVSSQCSLFTCKVRMIALSSEAKESSLIDGWSLVFEDFQDHPPLLFVIHLLCSHGNEIKQSPLIDRWPLILFEKL